jgi:cysteinyl-tRNA synthetase
MSMKFLGPTFDIHCGGVDNMFPHHDDEIAQSEAATGQTFVHVWLHCAHLIVEGKKMSKSAGNFFTLRDLKAKGYGGREIRYELIATHYRQSLNFTFEGLDGAKSALQRLDAFRSRLAEAAGGVAASASVPEWAVAARAGFAAGLADDLNISGAMAAVFDMLRAGNREMDTAPLDPSAAAAALAVWDGFDRVLGFLAPPAAGIPAGVQALVDERAAARAAKNWAESDRLRAAIEAAGFAVKDTPAGTKVTPR